LADTTTTSGFLMLQTSTTPNFGAGNLSGSFALGSTEDVTGVKGSIVGTFTFDGANKYTAIADIVGVPNAAIQANATFTGTTATNEDGAGVIDGGNENFVTNGTFILAIDGDGTFEPFLYVAVKQ
jgi:hypothetical protein